MKRIVTAVLSLIILLLSIPSVSFAVDFSSEIPDVRVEEYNKDYTEIFVGMGIVSAEYLAENADQPVTRGDFAKMLVEMLAFRSGDAPAKATKRYFDDVDVYHYAAGSIQYLVERGIVQGCGNGVFCIDRTVTAEEATTMLLRAMGYDALEAEGADATLRYQATAEIRDGLNGELNLKQSLKILYNAMFTETFVIHRISSTDVTYAKGDILLREIMGLDYYDGVLQTVGGRSILDNKQYDDEAVVDGYKLTGGSKFSADLLGFRARVFYAKDGADLKIVAIERLANKVLTIDARAFYGYENNSISYVGESEKLRKASLTDQKDILYNTCVVESIERYIPQYGEIRLIDNNSNNNYEVVMISGYESAVVSSVSQTDEIVQFKNHRAVKLSDYEIVEITDADGKKLELSDLKENCVATIYTYSDYYVKLKISFDQATGKIDSVKTDSNGWQKYKVDGNEYLAYADYYTKGMNIEPGETAVLLLDFKKRIVGILTDGDNDWRVGYILGVGINDESIKKCVSFKLLNQNGQIEELDTADTVRLDGVKNKNMLNLLAEINSVYGNFADVGADGQENVTTRVIRYYVNADGKITMLDTPTIISMLEDEGLTVTENNKLLMRVKGRLHRPENGYKFKIDSPGRAILKGEVEPVPNSTAFIVPEETNPEPDEQEDYSVKTVQGLKETKGGDYYIAAYNYAPESLMTDVLVIRKSTGSTADPGMMLITGVNDVYDESEERTVKEVSGYAKAAKIEYVVDEKNSTLEPGALKKGDVVSYKIQNGKAVIRELIWNEEGKGKLKEPGIYSDDGTLHYYAPFRVLLGKIKRVDGNFALLDLGSSDFKADLFTMPKQVMVYDTTVSGNPFYISESSAILTEKSGIGDTVIVAQGKMGGVTGLIVVKE